MKFKLESPFQPTGDQPRAIEKLTQGILDGKDNQVLLGVTGSGKTFTMSHVIQNIQKPTLIISHNKTLAGQLYQEFRDFFPENRVSYFVSYYDYYQPEAYIPTSDTYIEKETEINEEIDKLRLAATTNLLTRPDTIVVASVSCIYNLGSPVEYGRFILELKKGLQVDRNMIMMRLTDLQYERADYGFHRSSFRVRGETIEIYPSYEDTAYRLTLPFDKIEKIEVIDTLTGDILEEVDGTVIYPAKHYMTNPATYADVFPRIREDMEKQVKKFQDQGKILEAHRIKQRTEYDLEMIQELGFVNGIENYSRYFDGRNPGDPPYSLLDYFQHASKDWLLIVDESHITIPQIRGMYNGDRARKEVLIDYGFRLPSALDNRPLRFEEFMQRVNQAVYVSATPNEWELSLSGKDNIAEQLIRPTGLIDPEVEVRKSKGQIQDLMNEINLRVEQGERAIVTTLTKRMAEDLTSFLEEKGMKVAYLHADIETLKRQDILDDLRLGTYDVVVGINLLREGLDLPEVSLVAILDADKEGFLRSETSLVQTIGRSARHVNAKAILYADVETGSMKRAISEINRRREIQRKYNEEHGIIPQSIQKEIRKKLVEVEEDDEKDETVHVLLEEAKAEYLLPEDKERLLKRLSKEMREAAKQLDFEMAARIRDQIKLLKV